MSESKKDESDKSALLCDLFKLRNSFKSRYKSLSQLKGRAYQAKAAKRAYLDLNKLCKKYNI